MVSFLHFVASKFFYAIQVQNFKYKRYYWPWTKLFNVEAQNRDQIYALYLSPNQIFYEQALINDRKFSWMYNYT